MEKLILWGPDFVTGVGLLDDGHKRLIDNLNSLNDALSAGNSPAVLSAILNEFIQVAARHFGIEDRLMRQYHYADAESHIAQHKKLLGDIMTLRRQVETGNHQISPDTMRFLSDWLSAHILVTDAPFGHMLSAGDID